VVKEAVVEEEVVVEAGLYRGRGRRGSLRVARCSLGTTWALRTYSTQGAPRRVRHSPHSPSPGTKNVQHTRITPGTVIIVPSGCASVGTVASGVAALARQVAASLSNACAMRAPRSGPGPGV
jgi:hypothetical protein